MSPVGTMVGSSCGPCSRCGEPFQAGQTIRRREVEVFELPAVSCVWEWLWHHNPPCPPKPDRMQYLRAKEME